MKVTHLKAGDYRRQRWKNGGGWTTELAAESGLWRLSIAEIEQSGPFSDFAGYERTIMLLSGDGMQLDFEEAPGVRIDRPGEPFVFDGGWKAHCRLLGGPSTDMNLMVDRERARATLRVLALEAEAAMLEAAPCTLLYVLRGEARVGILGLDEAVEAGEVLRIDGAEDLPFPVGAARPGTAIVEIGISRR